MNLRLSCWAEGLKRVDALAVLTLWRRDGGTSSLLGRTEVIANSTSPDWTKSFVVTDYQLGEEQVVVISLYNDNDTGRSRKEKSSLGSVSFEIGSVISSAGAALAKELKNGQGVVALRVEEINEDNAGQLHLQLRGWNLKNLEGFGLGFNKSDPFFEILRERRDNSKRLSSTWDAVYRSKALENNLNPIWPEVFLDLDLLGTDINQSLRISVWDENKNGKHGLIGSVDVTIQNLVDNVNDTVFKATSKIDTAKSFALKNIDGETGKLLVEKAEVTGVSPQPKVDGQSAEPDSAFFSGALNLEHKSSSTDDLKLPPVEPTFVNYVAGGCELRVIVAIDCTQSNGNPSDVTSLHYCSDDSSRNEYEEALHEICSSLSKFDSDQLYPVFGFGAKSKDGTVSHCFPLCGDDVGHAVGVDGILRAYRETFRSGIELSQPRNFGKVIREAGQDAKKELRKGQAFSVLLIFTNGSPTNDAFKWSRAALKEVDDAPLSVVIVGVGKGGGFVNSKKLAEPVEGSRNKVTFVRYQKNHDTNALAKAALHNIPAQLEEYFIGKEIYPQLESESDEVSVEPYDEAEEVDVPLEFNDAGEVTLSRSVEVQVPRGKPGGPRNRRKMKMNNDPLGLNKVKGVKEARAALRQARQIRRQVHQAKNLFQQVGKLF